MLSTFENMKPLSIDRSVVLAPQMSDNLHIPCDPQAIKNSGGFSYHKRNVSNDQNVSLASYCCYVLSELLAAISTTSTIPWMFNLMWWFVAAISCATLLSHILSLT